MKTLVVASECGAGLFPKNSIPGFKNCLDLGVDGIEFDVHLSADGHVVVQHDYLLNKHITRDSTGSWLTEPGPGLGDLPLANIKQYDVGRYSSGARENKEYPSYKPVDGTSIPTLAEFIELTQLSTKKTPTFWLELKTDPLNRELSAKPEALLDTVLQDLTDANLIDSTVLLAFEWDLLIRAQNLCPEIETDFLTINRRYLEHSYRKQGSVNPDDLYGKSLSHSSEHPFQDSISKAGGTWWGPLASDVTQEEVNIAQDLGLRVNLWGVISTTEGMRDALAKRPDAITLSRPDKLMALLNPI